MSAEVGLTKCRVERRELGLAQRACPEAGPFWALLQARANDEDENIALNAHRKEFGITKPNDVYINNSTIYELQDGLLYRRVYDVKTDTLTLKCVAPSTVKSQIEVAAQGQRPMPFRNWILQTYHNAPLGGHLGRDHTYEAIAEDWWWSGLYEDVRMHCKQCQFCQQENGRTALNAYRRVDLFSRPFRHMQIDTIKCGKGDGGYTACLTAIDNFSRYPWIIPIKDETAAECGKALLEKVFLDFFQFPVAINSDAGPAFLQGLLKEINKSMGVNGIISSAYHPQSQGTVERLHRTINAIMRALVEKHPKDWVRFIPFVQGIIRATPVKHLGNRSPLEVIIGLKPTRPQSLVKGEMVFHQTEEEYIKWMLSFFPKMWDDVHRAQQAQDERQELEMEGSNTRRVVVGDLVAVKRYTPPRAQADRQDGGGSARFDERCYPDVYRVNAELDHNTFTVEFANDRNVQLPFQNKLSADRLVLLDMPEFTVDPNQNRSIEILTPKNEWRRATIQKYGVDGKIQFHYVSEPSKLQWEDPTNLHYRWIL